MKSAVFEQDFRSYDPEKSLKKKTGAYREEFIQSICNKSGVFVQEFREIKDDPYAREEFIMSISLKNAQFGKIDEIEIHYYHMDEFPKVLIFLKMNTARVVF